MADNVTEIKTEETRNKKFQIGMGTIIIIIIMILAAYLIYHNFIADKKYDEYSVVMSVERDDNGTTQYVKYGEDKVIKYGRDGITAIDSMGKQIWTASYEMKNPKVAVCKDSVAVADIGNKALIIYNKEGKAQNVEILHPISHVEVSEQGIAAVVLEDETCSYIQICDGDTLYTEIKTRLKEDGYPIDIAYSPDGKKLITSYAYINGESVETKVTFYNFSEVGKNYDSDIVKAEDFGDKMVPYVSFIDDTHVGVFLENRFVVYEMRELPVVAFESDEYKDNIKSIAHNNEYISVVLDNTSERNAKIMTFSLNGKKTGECTTDLNYTDAVMSGEDLILYNDKEIQIVTKNGNQKYRNNEQSGIVKILPYKDKAKYYMINSDEIRLIKLAKGK